MDFNNIYDLHTHSNNSFDGKHSCVLLCEHAIKNGAKGIAITDHLDIDDPELDIRHFTTNQYVDTFSVKKTFKNVLEVYQGIELGQGIYRKELSQEIMQKFKYDIVVGSIHNLENMKDFYFLDYNDYDVNDLLKRYFKAELELIKWNKCDVLAHLTYPLRYICGKYKMKVNLNDYDNEINEILEALVKYDTALEVNTSSLYNYHNDFMPGESIVKRYKELGGKYVTAGSDAHYCYSVCSNLDAAYALLYKCGFRYTTVYRNREPFLIELK
ncbi:MAG: histidinol-phosphatase HisJ family protein [Eubacterium sp.]|nr:histidinol-phosphatase HisJ family protein [Eubacterium sp.]